MIEFHDNSEIMQLLIASATLVDFPQFSHIHHLIPRVLDFRPYHLIASEYHEIRDLGKWKIYVKYRRILSRFLTDQTCSGSMFVGRSRYVDLAKYLAPFLTEDMV